MSADVLCSRRDVIFEPDTWEVTKSLTQQLLNS